MVQRSGDQIGHKVTFIQNNFYHDAFFLKTEGESTRLRMPLNRTANSSTQFSMVFVMANVSQWLAESLTMWVSRTHFWTNITTNILTMLSASGCQLFRSHVQVYCA